MWNIVPRRFFLDDLFNDFDGIALNNNILLDELTKYFVNKFIFEIHEIKTKETFGDLLNNLKKLFYI